MSDKTTVEADISGHQTGAPERPECCTPSFAEKVWLAFPDKNYYNIYSFPKPIIPRVNDPKEATGISRGESAGIAFFLTETIV